MDKLHTTIRKVLNEGIGYAEDQGFGGYAKPVYGGNNNNQGAFRRMSGPPTFPPDYPSPPRPSNPTPYPEPTPNPFPSLPPVSPQYRRIGMGDRRSQPTDYKGRYITPTVDPYGGYQTRSLPYGGRAEPTDFGGYANPYGG